MMITFDSFCLNSDFVRENYHFFLLSLRNRVFLGCFIRRHALSIRKGGDFLVKVIRDVFAFPEKNYVIFRSCLSLLLYFTVLFLHDHYKIYLFEEKEYRRIEISNQTYIYIKKYCSQHLLQQFNYSYSTAAFFNKKREKVIVYKVKFHTLLTYGKQFF